MFRTHQVLLAFILVAQGYRHRVPAFESISMTITLCEDSEIKTLTHTNTRKFMKTLNLSRIHISGPVSGIYHVVALNMHVKEIEVNEFKFNMNTYTSIYRRESELYLFAFG